MKKKEEQDSGASLLPVDPSAPVRTEVLPDSEWTPEHLRCLAVTVRAQCWPISDKVKSALESAAGQIEELEIPAPSDMAFYRRRAEELIGFARCGYLDLRSYQKLVKVLSESLAETAMVIQEFSDNKFGSGNAVANEHSDSTRRSAAQKSSSHSIDDPSQEQET